MRILAAGGAVLVAVVAIYLFLFPAPEERLFSEWPADLAGDTYNLSCEHERIDPDLCRLVARQLVLEQHRVHPDRRFYDITVARDEIVMCWRDVSAPMPDDRFGCVTLDEDGAPTPAPRANSA